MLDKVGALKVFYKNMSWKAWSAGVSYVKKVVNKAKGEQDED